MVVEAIVGLILGVGVVLFIMFCAGLRSKKVRCFLFHSWGRWETVSEGDVVKKTYIPSTGFERNFVKGHFELQKKTCTVCGTVKLQRFET